MQNIENMIQESFKKQVDSGEMQKLVDEKVRKFMEETVSSVLSTYSDAGKALRKKLGDDLCARIGDLGLDGYNQFIVDAVRSRIDDVYLPQARRHVGLLLDELTQKPKDEYTLSELIDLMKASVNKIDLEGDGANFTFIMEASPVGGDDFAHVRMDPCEDVRSYDCRYHLSFYKGKLFKTETKHKPSLKSGNSFSDLLFHINAWQTPVKLDIKNADEVDTEYNWEDEE